MRDLVAVDTGGASGIGAPVVRHIVGSGVYAAIIDLNDRMARALAGERGSHAKTFRAGEHFG